MRWQEEAAFLASFLACAAAGGGVPAVSQIFYCHRSARQRAKQRNNLAILADVGPELAYPFESLQSLVRTARTLPWQHVATFCAQWQLGNTKNAIY